MGLVCYDALYNYIVAICPLRGCVFSFLLFLGSLFLSFPYTLISINSRPLTTSPRMTQKCAQRFVLHKKLFFYILDMCIINSYIMHKEVGVNKSLGVFKLELVKNIITSSTLPNYCSRDHPHSGPTSLHLQGHHFPEKIQPPSNSNNEYYKK